ADGVAHVERRAGRIRSGIVHRPGTHHARVRPDPAPAGNTAALPARAAHGRAAIPARRRRRHRRDDAAGAAGHGRGDGIPVVAADPGMTGADAPLPVDYPRGMSVAPASLEPHGLALLLGWRRVAFALG